MVAGHEALAPAVGEQRPLPTQRLREEEAGCAGSEKSRGMKLNELEIRDRSARAVGQGNAVPGRLGWIGRLAVEATRPSRREHKRTGTQDSERSRGLVEDQESHATVSEKDEVHREGPTQKGDGWKRGDAGEKGPHDLPAGGVPVGMQDTAPTVGPFPGESQSRSVPVEAGPPVDELLDPERPFLHQNSHRRFVAKAIPCPEGVLKVELDPVLFRKG